jgi:hypothetical protein
MSFGCKRKQLLQGTVEIREVPIEIPIVKNSFDLRYAYSFAAALSGAMIGAIGKRTNFHSVESFGHGVTAVGVFFLGIFTFFDAIEMQLIKVRIF